MRNGSDQVPVDPVERGILKRKEDVTRPSDPAREELRTYQRMTEPANRPASPLRMSVAMDGLKAAKISRGTKVTISRMRKVVPSATGASESGSDPPRPIPVMRARNVQM
jgi:hypothetical protein